MGYFPERDQHTVAAFDLSSFEIVNRTALPDGSKPHMLRVDPKSETVWVQTAAGGTNEVLDAGTLSSRHSRKLGKVPVTNGWTPDGRFAYATLHGENKVAVIDTATMEMVKTLPAGDQPFGLIVMPRPRAPMSRRSAPTY